MRRQSNKILISNLKEMYACGSTIYELCEYMVQLGIPKGENYYSLAEALDIDRSIAIHTVFWKNLSEEDKGHLSKAIEGQVMKAKAIILGSENDT